MSAPARPQGPECLRSWRVLKSGDDYASSAKPQIDWDDEEARAELIDSRAKDGFALVMALSGRELAPPVKEAATLLLTVLGQDLEERQDGVFAIAQRVAPDRVISTVDPETRHGHKTAAHGFDGYKAHVAIDPESELVTATRVTPGNLGDAAPAAELLADLLEEPAGKEPAGPVAYGDNAYGTGELHALLERSGITDRLKTQSPVAPQGRFSKDQRATRPLDAGLASRVASPRMRTIVEAVKDCRQHPSGQPWPSPIAQASPVPAVKAE